MSAFTILLGSASTVITSGANAACGSSCNKSLLPATFATIANTLTYLVGAVSVIMIIVGGLRYVTSNGDQKNVTAAKDTILYAVIGVVVAIVAFAVVQFVATHIGS